MVDQSSDDGVVWLYDPELDAALHVPAVRRPTEVFALLDEVLAEAGIDDVVVTGAVEGLRRRARWWSFDVVETSADGDAPAATLRCVVFARQMPSIEADLAAAGTALADGAVATVTGTLGTNAAWGELRVVASGIVIENERSLAARARERLVDRLVASGEAAAQRHLVLPDRLHRIGVLAGAGTAGGADIDRLLEASGHDWEVVRRAVPMAGARAAHAVADGVCALADCRADVIVVARGGGARGEMAWADSETVAQAVVRCPVPVWTAIGHATDRTVVDLVAHRSCATPSAAAAGLIAMVDADAQRQQFAAVTTAHAAAIAGMAARVRVAWILAFVVLLVLVAVLVAGVGR